ncbi:hypothetical protein K1719_004870 [Acacia pycnantha]|nr:hypothetical protein K1719_004870 [Acacia pycnantha]
MLWQHSSSRLYHSWFPLRQDLPRSCPNLHGTFTCCLMSKRFLILRVLKLYIQQPHVKNNSWLKLMIAIAGKESEPGHCFDP